MEDVEWYWDAVVKDLGLEFSTPYEKVLDTSRGVPWATWFSGGPDQPRVELRRPLGADSPAKDRPAIIGESETGEVSGLTSSSCTRRSTALAAGLLEMGVGKGDAVGVFMPMRPEAAVAAYARGEDRRDLHADLLGLRAARRGGAAERREAKALITADGTWRRGKHGLMKPVADEAVADCAVDRARDRAGEPGRGHADDRRAAT